ncbi:MAG: type II secretion system protein [Actinobacteria bacterium]|nr:type II secretion system protein [Actinomycetota bacterium]
MKPRQGADRGITLLELLITMVLMSLAFAAVLGGMGLFLKAANDQRSMAGLDADIRTYAEALIASPYSDCADAATYESAMQDLADSMDVVATVDVAYWDGNVPAAFGPVCSTDLGVQQLTVSLRAGDGVTTDLVVGKSR